MAVGSTGSRNELSLKKNHAKPGTTESLNQKKKK